MPQNARSSHSEADPGTPCDKTRELLGPSESKSLGEKGGSIYASKAASAAFHNQADDISGNTSVTHDPDNILNTSNPESQGEEGQVVEVISDDGGKELQIQNKYGIGIDVHSKFLVISVLVRRKEKVILFTRQFDTSYDDIKKAKEWAISVIERHSKPRVKVGKSLNYCIESTATFHMPVLHVWEGNPAVVNPMLAKAGRRKSDILDSIQLATFDLYGTWARTYIIPMDVHELRVLVHERNHYEKLATQCINRILNTLTRFGCTLGREGSIKYDKSLRAMLECMLKDTPIIPSGYFPKPLPESVRKIIREELEAHDTYEAKSLEYQERMVQRARSIQWDFGDGTAPGDKVIETLMTTPQIGEITAVVFLANIVTPKRFPKPKNLAAYCGLDPSVQTSAGHKTSNRGRGGNKAVHDAIGMAAIRLIHCHTEMFGRWGYDMIQSGTSHNKARNAVARKLVVSMYYMLLKGEVFSYENYSIAEKYVILVIPVEDLVLLDEQFKRYIKILLINGISDTRKLIIEYYSCNLDGIRGLGRKFFRILKEFIGNQKAYKKMYKELKEGRQQEEEDHA